MSINLTQGAILDSYNNNTDGEPIIQVIDVKELPPSNGNKRYRLVISDGVHYQQAMLATQLNHLVENGSIKQHCIVQFKEYISNVVSGRRLIIILQLEPMGAGPGHQIGNPVNVDKAGASASSASTPAGGNSGGSVPSYMNRNGGGAAKPAQTKQHFHPIASLNPYQNRWTIKARVTSKGDVRTWSNARGDGKLCSVDLLDAHGGQIKATMFNDACEKFYEIFQENQVYTISRGQLKIANKKYSSIPNEYELTLNADAEVHHVGEDTEIQTQKFDFYTLDLLEKTEPNETVDVIGVVKNVSELAELTSQKTQRELKKRVISITDASLMGIDITLWGDSAVKYTEDLLAGNPVVCFKAMRVSDYGGRSLNSSFTSGLFINMDIPEAHKLKQWWDTQGNSATVQNLSGNRNGGGGDAARKTFEQVTTEGLGTNLEKPDYFAVKGTITFFRHDFDKPPWYMACPDDKCNKKVTQNEQDGTWYCEKCSKAYPDAKPRYILSLLCCDSTGSHWLTAFNESAEALLGVSAVEVNELKASGNESGFNRIFSEANFATCVFKVRAKADTMQDEQKVRCHVLNATPMNFKQESIALLDQIAAYA